MKKQLISVFLPDSPFRSACFSAFNPVLSSLSVKTAGCSFTHRYVTLTIWAGTLDGLVNGPFSLVMMGALLALCHYILG